MRRFAKNCTPFWYANYVESEMITNDSGYKTGEKRAVYSKAIAGYENISPASGEAITAMFGNYQDYTNIILTYDPNFPMDENSILWIDKDPEIDANGYATAPHNYVVRRVSKSLNTKVFAIQKVSKS